MQKNGAGKTAALVAAAVLTMGMPGRAPAAAEWLFPSVSVLGEATVTAMPDLAVLTAGVTSEAKTPREASEANARAMSAVIAAAREAGVAEKDIRTARYSITPVHAQRRDAAPQVTGYRVSNQVEAKLRELGKVGEVLDALVTAGATNVGNVEFMIAEPAKLLDHARRAAFEDARRKAELYAKAAGAQLGRTVSISEDADLGGRPVPMRAGLAAAAPTTPIALGEERLRVHVSVSFELNQ